MALAPDIRRLIDRLGEGTPFPQLGPVKAREEYRARIRELVGAGPVQACDTEDTELAGVPARVYRPVGAGGPAAPGVVFFHGGGWVIGDLDTHDTHCRALCVAADAVVVSVAYRRAPEHPYPAPLEDCWAVTEHVARHAADLGIDRSRLAVAGDSAGGNLAAAVTLRAREAAVPLRAQLLVYPVTDPTMSTESYRTFGDDHYLTAEAMRWFIDAYLPDPATRTLPLAGPLHAPDLAGLPPAVVVTAEYDPLRDEGAAYAGRLREAGVPTTEISVPATVHGFLEFAHEVPAARRSRDDILLEFAALIRADRG
jgi:acetyl esterase/lipase